MIELLLPGALLVGGVLAGWFWWDRHQLAKRLEAEAKARALVQAAREAEKIRTAQAEVPRPDRRELDNKLGGGQF